MDRANDVARLHAAAVRKAEEAAAAREAAQGAANRNAAVTAALVNQGWRFAPSGPPNAAEKQAAARRVELGLTVEAEQLRKLTADQLAGRI